MRPARDDRSAAASTESCMQEIIARSRSAHLRQDFVNDISPLPNGMEWHDNTSAALARSGAGGGTATRPLGEEVDAVACVRVDFVNHVWREATAPELRQEE